MGETLALVGKALALMGEALALMGKALALVGKGERGVGGLNPGVHLQEVVRHCREPLGGLRVEGLGMGSLRVDGRLGVLGWEGGGESGKVVEGWSREAWEGA